MADGGFRTSRARAASDFKPLTSAFLIATLELEIHVTASKINEIHFSNRDKIAIGNYPLTTSSPIRQNTASDRAALAGYRSVFYREANEYCERDFGEPLMEFRLTYQGPLLAERDSGAQKQERLKHKHRIRKSFCPQLEELWKTHPALINLYRDSITLENPITKQQYPSTRALLLAEHYTRDGIKWLPLINTEYGLLCSVNILFLRREHKGGIIQTGDLDNRIKLLFDALAIPKENEIPSDETAASQPNPFFCLLEDDRLITEFRVTADRLLIPEDPSLYHSERGKEVLLVVEVKTMMNDPDKAYFELGV
ncbi:MAG TPA: hypothetical protein VEG64_04870 [Candidatus Sulfotelmatobacter sp.]|nr:hypothetical protein [Candidatus Sulfotelmatobacter sp.]